MVVNLNFWMLKSCEMPLKRASHHHPLSKSWRSTHDLPKVFFSNVIISWSVGNLAEKLANSGARMALLVQCLHDRQKNLWRRGAKSLESCRSAEAAQQRWEQQIFPLGFVWESGTPLILCHQPPMTGNGNHTTYKIGDLGDGLFLFFPTLWCFQATKLEGVLLG